MRVVVIGAGVAGLAAAYTLVRGGLDPIVFEGTDHVGGRLYSSLSDGCVLDHGAQVLYSTYKTCLTLCRELGIAHELLRFEPTVDILHEGKLYRQFAILNTWKKRLSIAKLFFYLFRWRNRLAINNPALMPVELANQDFAQYVRAHHDKALLDDLFRPFTASLVHDHPEHIAAGVGLAYVRCALGHSYTLRNGMGTLAVKLSENIRRLHLNTPITCVHLEDNRVTGVCINNENGKQVVTCDAVVVATPAGISARLIPDLSLELQTFLKQVQYSKCVHVIYRLQRSLLGDAYAVIIPSKSGLKIASLLEDANKRKNNVPSGEGLLHAMTYGTASEQLIGLSDEEIVATISRDVRQVLPQFPDVPNVWQLRRWDQSVCLFGPGYREKLTKFLQQVRSIQGLHFAGDFVKIPSIEGALRSGQEAAEAILLEH